TLARWPVLMTRRTVLLPGWTATLARRPVLMTRRPVLLPGWTATLPRRAVLMARRAVLMARRPVLAGWRPAVRLSESDVGSNGHPYADRQCEDRGYPGEARAHGPLVYPKLLPVFPRHAGLPVPSRGRRIHPAFRRHTPKPQ